MTGHETGPAGEVDVRVTDGAGLSDSERADVLTLAADVAANDGVAALSEAFVLGLRPGSRGATTGGHVLARRRGQPGLLGYAGVAPDASAELFVSPGSRRQQVGRRLWNEAKAVGAQWVWAHGDLPEAQALAASEGLDRVRELHLMSRTLVASDTTDPVLPQGLSVRTFRPGSDDEQWVALNAAAFAHHREQGALTIEDLHERMAQEWFDPAGFFLIEDRADPDRGPIAFHWTKNEGAHGTGRAHGSGSDEGAHGTGEVYVVGVHPAYQGRGLARPLTRLGIAHLARRGLARVELYVDGDNSAAVATYVKEGFTIASTDVMYARPSAARMGA